VSRVVPGQLIGLRARGIAPTPRQRAVCPAGGLLRRRDLDVLAWTGEQYAARTDQLETLMGAGPRTVQRTLARLRAHGLVTTRRLLAGESAWVLPTTAGLRACGSSFGVWQPRVGLLAHVAAVNDVRLHVQQRSRDSQWIAERALARDRRSGEHLPDAVVLADGQRVAIEVELTVKSQRRTTAIVDELARRFDAVVYFCAPGPHRQLSELADTGRWPTLGVRQLPRQQDG
jgi:Replication-relaxation